MITFRASIIEPGMQEKYGLVETLSGCDHCEYYSIDFKKENYVLWFQYQLLANLLDPSIIILENALCDAAMNVLA